MNRLMRILLVIIGVSALLSVVSQTHAQGPTYYPDNGDLWYDGYYFADSYLLWSNPGGWSVGDPGYEHDFSIRSHYFTNCTTWTNLPAGYDDCPTAGVSEPSDLWTFSFGSFHVSNVTSWTWYYGSWNFSGGYSWSSDYILAGQENRHQFCQWDSIWCMGATRTQPLLSGWLNWTQTLYRYWGYI